MSAAAKLSQRLQRMERELGRAFARRVIENTLRNLYKAAAARRRWPSSEQAIGAALKMEGF